MVHIYLLYETAGDYFTKYDSHSGEMILSLEVPSFQSAILFLEKDEASESFLINWFLIFQEPHAFLLLILSLRNINEFKLHRPNDT